jgi:two-component system NarL family sensor kinase
MHTQQEILSFIIATAFLLFLQASFIVTMFLLNRKQQHGFIQEVAFIKSGFEKELFTTQLEMQEATFQHISLELHDNVGHFLSLAKLHLTSLKIPLAKEVTDKIEAAVLLISYSMEEIRGIGRSLDKEGIISNGLLKTVHQQVEQLKKLGQFAINLTVTGNTVYLEDQKEIFLYRIMQESINNIVKHSKADLININFHYDDQKLLLSIHDNGVGFRIGNLLDSKSYGSSGLKNIIKRSSLINATHEILSEPEEGTTIKITTPY